MKITNHRLEGAAFVKANVSGGLFQAPPTGICLHDTAGRLDPGNSVAWFASPGCTNASAHFTIERDGTITQQVDCNKVAWHAGESTYKGRRYCNAFMFGIEIVNPGRMKKEGDRAKAWFDQSWPISETRHANTPEHGDGYWMDYTPEQVRAVTELCRALIAAYPSVTAITTHWFISPKRKVDVNPIFPLEKVAREAFLPAEEPGPHASDESAMGPDEHLAIPAADPPKKAGVMSVLDTADRNYAKLNELADKGSRVAQILRRVKNWFWGLIGGGSLLGGGGSQLVDTKKGTAAILMAWVEAHPFLFVLICGSLLAVALYCAAKAIEKFLVTAYRDNRYQPRG